MTRSIPGTKEVRHLHKRTNHADTPRLRVMSRVAAAWPTLIAACAAIAFQCCVSALGQTLNASQPGCEFSWLTVCRDGTLVLFSKRDRCGILNTHRREVAPSRDPPEPVALAAGVRPDCARGRETEP